MSAPASIAIPLPPPPATDPFSDAQWRILAAIADTIITPFGTSKANRLLQHPLRHEVYDSTIQRWTKLHDNIDPDLAAAYLGESATAQPAFKDEMFRMFAFSMSDANRNALKFVLDTLK